MFYPFGFCRSIVTLPGVQVWPRYNGADAKIEDLWHAASRAADTETDGVVEVSFLIDHSPYYRWDIAGNPDHPCLSGSGRGPCVPTRLSFLVCL